MVVIALDVVVDVDVVSLGDSAVGDSVVVEVVVSLITSFGEGVN